MRVLRQKQQVTTGRRGFAEKAAGERQPRALGRRTQGAGGEEGGGGGGRGDGARTRGAGKWGRGRSAASPQRGLGKARAVRSPSRRMCRGGHACSQEAWGKRRWNGEAAPRSTAATVATSRGQRRPRLLGRAIERSSPKAAAMPGRFSFLSVSEDRALAAYVCVCVCHTHTHSLPERPTRSINISRRRASPSPSLVQV